MSNLATALRKEISRLARKEVKAALISYKSTLAQQRDELKDLKKQVKLLEQQMAQLTSGIQSKSATVVVPADEVPATRFSPKRLRSHRKRIELSAEDYAKLVGVSMQTIYHWEQGKSRPRMTQQKRLAVVGKMGKRESRKRLAALQDKATNSKTSNSKATNSKTSNLKTSNPKTSAAKPKKA